MKIAILGTRGIPNNYGGFEQMSEYLSQFLIDMGHDVFVYNSSLHPYKLSSWNGVNIIHCYDPENKIGTAGQFIYDLNCILDSRKRGFDVILQLGYTSSSIWWWLFDNKSKIVTNMDGLEWKRSKYGNFTKKFLRFAEKLAAVKSDYLVADSIGIQEYLTNTYKRKSTYIAYGANAFLDPVESVLLNYGLKPHEFDMLIARMEPENNIEIILEGVTNSNLDNKFIVVGNYTNQYGTKIFKKFSSKKIIFLGGIYDINILNNLRYYSNLYFHGHSVGGTNPSLLEAMASQALICAHNNIFNKSILQDSAYYFSSADEVEGILTHVKKNEIENVKIINNLNKIKNEFSWVQISNKYQQLLMDIIN